MSSSARADFIPSAARNFIKKAISPPFRRTFFVFLPFGDERAFSSVGQSGRLITGWSWVQVPEGPPYCGPVVQLVRTPACHAGGHGFEPHSGRHFFRLLGLFAGVAQLAEQLICNQQVAGSSPIASSTWVGSRVAKGSRL